MPKNSTPEETSKRFSSLWKQFQQKLSRIRAGTRMIEQSLENTHQEQEVANLQKRIRNIKSK